MSPTLDLGQWIRDELFDAVPVSIATIDRELNVVLANRSFEETFGAWAGRKCFEVYKGRDTACDHCEATRSFEDGRARVTHEIGTRTGGAIAHYVKRTFPIMDEDGTIHYLVEMSSDVTDLERLREQNLLLFEQVPCSLCVLDGELRIVRANRSITRSFGAVEGQFCWDVFKGRSGACRRR